jgi:hypothetical protein
LTWRYRAPSVKAEPTHDLIASEQGSLRSKLDVIAHKPRMFRAKFDVIIAEFDVFEHTVDVIVNELKKYSPNARKV